MTKYKEYCQRMIQQNQEAFAKFLTIHNQYGLDEDRFQEVFNKEGEKILKIIKEWENKLCQQSEKAGFSNYTGNLAEKFQTEVKKEFPLIDHIGIIVKPFVLKRISF